MTTRKIAAKTPRKSVAPGARAVAATPLVDVNADAAAPEMAQRVTFLVHRVSARIAMVGNRHFLEHGLNHFSARILVLMLEREELRTGELVDLMVLPQSTISSQLLALHKRRLIRRRRSRQDNRSVILTLTPAGIELARDCNQLSLRVHAATLRDIPERERQIAFAFLRKIDERLAEIEQQTVYPFHEPEQLQALVAPDTVGRAKRLRGGVRAVRAKTA